MADFVGLICLATVLRVLAGFTGFSVLLASLENDLIRPSVFNTVLQMLPDTGGIAKCDERFLFHTAIVHNQGLCGEGAIARSADSKSLGSCRDFSAFPHLALAKDASKDAYVTVNGWHGFVEPGMR